MTALLLTPAASHAGLVLLDFKDVPIPGGVDSAPFFTYQSQGFTLTATDPSTGFLSGFQAHGENSIFYAGAVGVQAFAPASGPPNVISLTRDGCLTFDADAIDLARNFAFDPAPTVTFTGVKAGGGTVTQSFTVTTPAGTAAFQTFQFVGFTDLVELRLGQPVVTDRLNQFTNVKLTTPAAIPEPATTALLGMGVFGVAGVVRRFRKA